MLAQPLRVSWVKDRATQLPFHIQHRPAEPAPGGSEWASASSDVDGDVGTNWDVGQRRKEGFFTYAVQNVKADF